MTNIPADYHIHTVASPDGASTMSEICEAALEKGLREICFTDHYEIYTPGFPGSRISPPGQFTIQYLKQQQHQFLQCRQQYGNRLILRYGIELGQPHVNPQDTAEVMRQFSFDYIVASQHKLHDIDLSQQDYLSGDISALEEANLNSLFRMVKQCDIDCVAHIDLIKRYAALSGQAVSVLDHPQALDEIMSCMIGRGIGLEINTSGLRQKLGELLPGIEILKRYRRLGGEIITFGSDAHHADDLASGFEQAAEAAASAGFSAYAVYSGRKCRFLDL